MRTERRKGTDFSNRIYRRLCKVYPIPGVLSPGECLPNLIILFFLKDIIRIFLGYSSRILGYNG